MTHMIPAPCSLTFQLISALSPTHPPSLHGHHFSTTVSELADLLPNPRRLPSRPSLPMPPHDVQTRSLMQGIGQRSRPHNRDKNRGTQVDAHDSTVGAIQVTEPRHE